MQSAVIKAVLVAAVSHGALAPIEWEHKHTREYLDKLEADFAASGQHLYVHIIPHSHDDVGWLKTPDEYFMGSNQHS